jgi:tetratricopeptide (TPR) repeat protein
MLNQINELLNRSFNFLAKDLPPSRVHLIWEEKGHSGPSGSMPDPTTASKSNNLVGTDKHGQFVLAVDGSRHNPDDLFEQAQSAEEDGDIAEAERLYRILMKSDPTDASAPFNLGNLLRASARNVEAEAALRAATRVDPLFADAWYNLSDLLDEQGRSEAAIECLRTVLRVAPDYADAMFNLALLFQRTNQYAEAANYWRRYLASDCQSEWAARARRSLKFC